MKKIFAFAAAAIIAVSASAQVTFGVKGGLNLSKTNELDNVNSDDINRITGFNAGLVAEYPVALGVGVRGELLYQTYGFKYENTTAGVSTTIKNKMNYLAVPVLCEYALPFLDEHLKVYGGIQLGYCLGGNMNSEVKSSLGTVTSDSDYESDDYNAFDLGGVIGIELMATDFLGIDARWTRGTMPVYTNGNADDSGKNDAISLGLIFKF